MNSDTNSLQPNAKLLHLRLSKGWTQQEVADRLYALYEQDQHGSSKRGSGINADTVSRWERGITIPSPLYRARLCILFGVTSEELGFNQLKRGTNTSPMNMVAPLSPNSTSTNTIPETDVISIHQLPFSTHPERASSYLNEIVPLPPRPYFAHPYPLQENFTGRLHERQSLTEWLLGNGSQILAIVALGGMGKSALTWSWLQQDVSRFSGITRLQGILWWSFYETEAHFTTFLNHALTYVSNGTIDPSGIPSVYERVQVLVRYLQNRRFLIILDGFERELRTYASDQEGAELEEIPDQFRTCIDPYMGSFLRWLAASPLESKILLTSRLFPHELDGLTNCLCKRLEPLSLEDAVAFFQAQGVHWTRSEIQNICNAYGNHPLALRLLTGMIMRDPILPGDISAVSEHSLLPKMVQREHHILKLTYETLKEPIQQLLSRLAAFRSKVTFDTMKVVSTFDNEYELKDALWELAGRGLVFFDRERGTYDLHPVVRRYAYTHLQQREDIHKRLVEHFQSLVKENLVGEPPRLPKKIRMFLNDSSSAKSIEDIIPTVELYHHMIQAKQFKRAFSLYYHSLASLLYHRLGAYQTVAELLEVFFSHDKIIASSLESHYKSWILDALANAYSALGYPQRAIQLLQASIHIDQQCENKESNAAALWNLAVQQLVLGRLSEAERSLQECIALCVNIKDRFNEAKAHQYLALLRTYQGLFQETWKHLDMALSISKELKITALECAILAYQALCKFLAGDIYSALTAAQDAHALGEKQHHERDIIRSEWLLGLILIRLATQEEDEYDTSEMLQKAEFYLSEALSRCRRINMMDYEADLLLAWARLNYARGDKSQTKKACAEALVITRRSDFRVLEADVYNLLARVELEDGNIEKAISCAQLALADATCDSLPYCYQLALEQAKSVLEEADRRK